MKYKLNVILCLMVIWGLFSCQNNSNSGHSSEGGTPVIFDTDTNNELDDQHALAYLLMSGNTFDVKGITVNATHNGGHVSNHLKEAERVLKLCTLHGKVPLLTGANGDFTTIKDHVHQKKFDGAQAVRFIIEAAKKQKENKLVVLAVGKLTNVALAIQKAPEIAEQIRLVWLGSNYPEPGEYNLQNDIPAMNFLLQSAVPFELVSVRYGKPSGTDAVRVTKDQVLEKMPGLGPKAPEPVKGRHGELHYTFGDYSANLFRHIDLYGEPPSRALFDMAAVAIVKNPQWAEAKTIPAPLMKDKQWVNQGENDRKIILWEDFDRDKIIADFYATLKDYTLVR